eukprot:jgi/Mesvir1/15936/Mv26458-RA.1
MLRNGNKKWHVVTRGVTSAAPPGSCNHRVLPPVTTNSHEFPTIATNSHK